jgi:hypothetical protein
MDFVDAKISVDATEIRCRRQHLSWAQQINAAVLDMAGECF